MNSEDRPSGPEAAATFASSSARAGNDELYAVVYDELRAIAGKLMRAQRPDHTLQPTELVHEAYQKLARGGAEERRERTHLLNLGARAMRHILVDHARERAAAKRGGGWHRVTVGYADRVGDERELEILELNDLLEKLERKSERLARIVELRVFAGLTVGEVSEVLGVSRRTVDRDWKVARARLTRDLS